MKFATPKHDWSYATYTQIISFLEISRDHWSIFYYTQYRVIAFYIDNVMSYVRVKQYSIAYIIGSHFICKLDLPK